MSSFYSPWGFVLLPLPPPPAPTSFYQKGFNCTPSESLYKRGWCVWGSAVLGQGHLWKEQSLYWNSHPASWWPCGFLQFNQNCKANGFFRVPVIANHDTSFLTCQRSLCYLVSIAKGRQIQLPLAQVISLVWIVSLVLGFTHPKLCNGVAFNWSLGDLTWNLQLSCLSNQRVIASDFIFCEKNPQCQL